MKTTSLFAKSNATAHQDYRVRPFYAGIIAAFTSWCINRGLSGFKVRCHLAALRRLESWFRCKHKRRPQDLSEDDIEDARRFYCVRTPRLASTLAVLGEFLKAGGFLKPGQALRKVKRGAYWRYRELPIFGGVVDAFCEWHLRHGFAAKTLFMHLDAFRRLVPWFLRRGKRSLEDLRAEDVEQIRRFYQHRKPWFAAAMGRLTDFLRERGRWKFHRPVALKQSEKEIARYAAYLRHECELANPTIYSHCLYGRRLLEFLRFDEGNFALRDLTLPKVEQFVCRMAHRCCRAVMPLVLGVLRKFLRFEFHTGVLPEPLHEHLESVRFYREQRLPPLLPWREFQKLLRLMDRSTPRGRRDFAILMLAASYGLRRSEVAALKLEDIDWRARTLRLAQPKTGHELMLPLTDEVAKALVDYLRHGRDTSTCRHLFLRVRPPSGALGLNGVACSLKRAVRTTGVSIQTKSFHALRHAFALRLLQQGTSLKHISEVLGHRSFNSTSAYLRLDVEDLRRVALPVPKTLSAAERRELGHCSAHMLAGCPDRKYRMPGTVTAPAAQGFRSFLAKPMQDFLHLRRAMGLMTHSFEWLLHNLDFFLAKRHAKARVFTAAMFQAWAEQQRSVSANTRRSWMEFIGRFCRYVARQAPATFVPDPRSFPKRRAPHAPCVLSARDIARLLAAAHRPKPIRTPEHPLRPKTMRMALLLLYCCGLRRAEVLNLRIMDIDAERQVLRIEQSKFHKSRLVPLSQSVSEELRKYLRARRRYKTPMEPSSPLLWSGRPNRINGAFSATGLRFNWQQICRYAGVFNQRGVPPRLHDLRHSFAVSVLLRAYRAGQDPQSTLPRLARYMGHVHFRFTHHYLHFIEPLRLSANKRFRHLMARILTTPAK